MIATGLAAGLTPDPELAAEAVRRALQMARAPLANSVLLFLTSEFAKDPQPALRAASRAASCTQIVGCTAAGIFTDEEWMLDAPAAAAMVFTGEVSLTPASSEENTPFLTLAAPNALHTEWLAEPGVRFGAVSGDATGKGPFKVWSGGRIMAEGRSEARMHGALGSIAVSQGVRPLSIAMEVTEVSGFDLLGLNMQPAMNTLLRDLPLELRELDRLPLHLLMAGLILGEAENAIAEGRYRLVPIIADNHGDKSLTLAARVPRGAHLFWALRQPLAAENDMRATLDRMAATLPGRPAFGLMFPCLGRGPYFYGGVDRDLELVKARYPGMPLIGFYGNGEIGPLNGENTLFQYSTVLGLFSEN